MKGQLILNFTWVIFVSLMKIANSLLKLNWSHADSKIY